MNGGYHGLLFIGDPHLEGRIPGFRRDDYPDVVLGKLEWCLDYARRHSLLPALLGDVFHLPRDNPNWLLVRLLELIQAEVLSIYGNHDCSENVLSDHDSLSILFQAGRLTPVDEDHIWCGRIGNQTIAVGGTPWGMPIPRRYSGPEADLVFWMTHHDLVVPGYEEQGRFKPREIPGIAAIVNGHIHRSLEKVERGGTSWFTPGNISRRSRSDATRSHTPSVLRVDIDDTGWKSMKVEVPHEPYDAVFHDEIVVNDESSESSSFVAGLAELQARRTETGAGLLSFIQSNIQRFDDDVADEILRLAKEVTGDEQ